MWLALFALNSAGLALEGSVGLERHLLVALKQTLKEARMKPSELGNALSSGGATCNLPFPGPSETGPELNPEPCIMSQGLTNCWEVQASVLYLVFAEEALENSSTFRKYFKPPQGCKQAFNRIQGHTAIPQETRVLSLDNVDRPWLVKSLKVGILLIVVTASVMYCCTTNHPQTSWLKTRMIISHLPPFRGSVREWPIWALLAQDIAWGCSQVQAGYSIIWSFVPGKSTSSFAHTRDWPGDAGCRLEASVLLHTGLLTGLLECPWSIAAGYLQKEQSKRPKRKLQHL